MRGYSHVSFLFTTRPVNNKTSSEALYGRGNYAAYRPRPATEGLPSRRAA